MDNITLIDNIISVTMPVISPNISNIIKIKYDKNILSPIYCDDFDNYNTGKHILSIFVNTNIPDKLQEFIENDKIDIKKYFNTVNPETVITNLYLDILENLTNYYELCQICHKQVNTNKGYIYSCKDCKIKYYSKPYDTMLVNTFKQDKIVFRFLTSTALNALKVPDRFVPLPEFSKDLSCFTDISRDEKYYYDIIKFAETDIDIFKKLTGVLKLILN